MSIGGFGILMPETGIAKPAMIPKELQDTKKQAVIQQIKSISKERAAILKDTEFTAVRHWNDGVGNLNLKKFNEAIGSFKKALAIYKKAVDFFKNKEKDEKLSAEHQKNIEKCESAIYSSYFNWGSEYFNEGLLLHKGKEFNKALPKYNEATSNYKEAEKLARKGEKNKVQEALANTYYNITLVHSAIGDGFYFDAQELVEKDQTEEGLKVYTKAKESYAMALNLLVSEEKIIGKLLTDSKLELAKKTFLRNSSFTYKNVGDVYEGRGELEYAKYEYEKGLKFAVQMKQGPIKDNAMTIEGQLRDTLKEMESITAKAPQPLHTKEVASTKAKPSVDDVINLIDKMTMLSTSSQSEKEKELLNIINSDFLPHPADFDTLISRIRSKTSTTRREYKIVLIKILKKIPKGPEVDKRLEQLQKIPDTDGLKPLQFKKEKPQFKPRKPHGIGQTLPSNNLRANL
ncbi:MAG: hypothetical protein KJ706_00760 [Candidatus Omnitrophica bacterium]|nr:hypothetical protein [Candidatus Omnitrophota bacterium]